MAARSLFLNFTQIVKCRRFSLRSFPSSVSRTEAAREESSNLEDDRSQLDDLKSRIFSLRLPKRSATNVLQRWVSEGYPLSISDLRHVSKELRKSQRYKHALEISEWMVTHDNFKLSDSDYAVRIDLMTKVFGVDAAERYFEGLPSFVKTSETYTALLHSYAGCRLIEKPEELYERIKKANLSLSALTYNELMTLYVSVGQVEKVASVVEEVKQHNVKPDLYMYNLWVSSCAAALDISGATTILSEMSQHPECNEDWVRYVHLASIYLQSANLVNFDSNSLIGSEESITQREWIAYDFLIILHGGFGNKDKLDRIWKSLRMTKQKMINRNYLCILSSYLMLGYLGDVREVLDKWKHTAATHFDPSICNRLLKAYDEVGLTQKSKSLRELLANEGYELDRVLE